MLQAVAQILLSDPQEGLALILLIQQIVVHTNTLEMENMDAMLLQPS